MQENSIALFCRKKISGCVLHIYGRNEPQAMPSPALSAYTVRRKKQMVTTHSLVCFEVGKVKWQLVLSVILLKEAAFLVALVWIHSLREWLSMSCFTLTCNSAQVIIPY